MKALVFCLCAYSSVDANVSEKLTASVFRAKVAMLESGEGVPRHPSCLIGPFLNPFLLWPYINTHESTWLQNPKEHHPWKPQISCFIFQYFSCTLMLVKLRSHYVNISWSNPWEEGIIILVSMTTVMFTNPVS